jgi:beta-phosphoglucomutase-like phosphatase (HAD superfamily)
LIYYFSGTGNSEYAAKKLAEKTSAKVEDCIVFDDSVHAIETAKNAGLKTVGIYEEAVKNTWNEMQEIADKTIKSFYELL